MVPGPVVVLTRELQLRMSSLISASTQLQDSVPLYWIAYGSRIAYGTMSYGSRIAYGTILRNAAT
jgi:hypothetical protein